MAFADALTDAREHRDALVDRRDGPDEFHDQHRLAHPGAAEQSGLATAYEGAEQVYYLYAYRQYFLCSAHLMQRMFQSVDAVDRCAGKGRLPVQRRAKNIHHPAEHFRPHRHLQWCTVVEDGQTAAEAGTAVQGNGAHVVFVKVLVHLKQYFLVADQGIQGPPQRRHLLAADDYHGALYLVDVTYRLPGIQFRHWNA